MHGTMIILMEEAKGSSKRQERLASTVKLQLSRVEDWRKLYVKMGASLEILFVKMILVLQEGMLPLRSITHYQKRRREMRYPSCMVTSLWSTGEGNTARRMKSQV